MREPGRGRCEERRGSVLLKGVREFFLEIFEKSIDKHKIDAILNAPSFRSGPLRGCFDGRASGRRIPRKNPVLPSRYKDSDEEWPGGFLRSGAGSGNG